MRRVLAGATVDGFAKEVGVAGVAAVLFDEVEQQPAQADVAAAPPEVTFVVESAGKEKLEISKD